MSMMSSRRSQMAVHSLKSNTSMVPWDIAQNMRSLPALPVSKRKLPILPQSNSRLVSAYSDKCVAKQYISHQNHHKKDARFSITLRNFFNKVQQKIGGPKTKLTKRLSKKLVAQKRVKIMEDKVDENNYSSHTPIKSKWRPNLKFICDDEELSNKLTIFMTKQYNEENILFLQSVNKLKNDIAYFLTFPQQINIIKREKINIHITGIYNQYILNNANKQINLASESFNNVMEIHQRFEHFSLHQKAEIFTQCSAEIQHLIRTSILPNFYSSVEFQSLARSRNIYTATNQQYLFNAPHLNNDQIQISGQIDYDSDDIDYGTKTEITDVGGVHFDVHSTHKWAAHNKYMLSSNGFAANSGCHEWKIQIVSCGNSGTAADRQEFGVISNFNTNIEMNEYGILDTPLFGARCVYGYNKLIKLNHDKKVIGSVNNFYYASYNDNNTLRCNKNLSQLSLHGRRWKAGDVIKICLDLTKGVVKFYLNQQKVRKTISIQRNVIYYPIILYGGKCRYKVIQ